MIRIHSVLVATDFGTAAETALNYGREFARAFGATLTVLHVIENPVIWAGPEVAGLDYTRVLADLEAGAQAALDRLVTSEDRAQLGAVTVIRVNNAPAFEIATYAKKTNADVIIMGTHGRGLMQHLLMGSVAEKVVRIAPCPVLTIRHPEHEFILPDALQVIETSNR